MGCNTLSNQDLLGMKHWLVRNGRVLDQARWNYHFENGDRNEVLRILESYQNLDGGFGHGLEADSWNPHSAPMQTWCALELLKELDVDPKEQQAKKILDGVFTYLMTTEDLEEGLFLACIPSNNDHPHAPWWHWQESIQVQWGYNPTAALSGLILHFSEEGSAVFAQGIQLAEQAVAHYFQNPLTESKHTLHGYQVLEEAIRKRQWRVNFSLDCLRERILENITYAITKDIRQWGNSYCNLPTDLIHSLDDPAYIQNKEITEQCIEFLLNSRNEEGVWNIPWTWGDSYPKAFAIAENWWKGSKVVEHVLLLKHFARLEGCSIEICKEMES